MCFRCKQKVPAPVFGLPNSDAIIAASGQEFALTNRRLHQPFSLSFFFALLCVFLLLLCWLCVSHVCWLFLVVSPQCAAPQSAASINPGCTQWSNRRDATRKKQKERKRQPDTHTNKHPKTANQIPTDPNQPNTTNSSHTHTTPIGSTQRVAT